MSLAFLQTIEAKIIGLLLAGVLTVSGIAYIFHKGETTGESKVTTAVQSKTISTLDKARVTKERADQTTADKPYDEKADGLK